MEEVINQKNLDAANELFADEHELHPETPGIGRGGEGMKRAFAGLHEQFPDVRVTIESMVAERGHGRRSPHLQRYGCSNG